MRIPRFVGPRHTDWEDARAHDATVNAARAHKCAGVRLTHFRAYVSYEAPWRVSTGKRPDSRRDVHKQERTAQLPVVGRC